MAEIEARDPSDILRWLHEALHDLNTTTIGGLLVRHQDREMDLLWPTDRWRATCEVEIEFYGVKVARGEGDTPRMALDACADAADELDDEEGEEQVLDLPPANGAAVERLDRSEPPPSWRCRRCSECPGDDTSGWAHHWMGLPQPARLLAESEFDEMEEEEDGEGEYVWACKHCRAEWPMEEGDLDGNNVGDPARLLEVAWARHEACHDVPGYQGVTLWGADGLPLSPALHVFLAPGEALDGDCPDPATQQHILARAVRTGEVDSVLRPAMWAHYWPRNRIAEDVRRILNKIDDGCPPPGDPWPRCLAWSDEHVAEVERWLVRIRHETNVPTPEVLRG